MPPPSGNGKPPHIPARPRPLMRMESFLLLALLTAAPLCQATCVIEGDMAFTPSQQISGSKEDGALFPPVGLLCVNQTHYEGEIATCSPDDDGKVVREDGGRIFACSEHHDVDTVCVQCGARRGGALCLPPTIPVEDLDCSEFEDEDYDDEGCLMGELNHVIPPGDVVTPEIMVSCNDDGTYVTTETTCGENWFLDVRMNFGNTCPENEVCIKDENGNFLCAAPPEGEGQQQQQQVVEEPVGVEDPVDEPAAPTPTTPVGATPVCIVGGKTYRVGEVVHVKEMECQDTDATNVPNRYKGDAFVCMENGEVEEDEENKDKHACPTERPYCVQCGPKELDIAVCHTEPGSDTVTLPESCADLLTGDGTPDVDTAEPGCLLATPNGGGVTFLRGESMGFMGLRCMPDGVSYEAVESVCGDGGSFEETSVVIRTCEGVTPHCVQCGTERRLGGAMCHERDETPPECMPGYEGAALPTTTTTSPTQAPTPKEQTGCLATYKANAIAEYVGVRCLSDTTFEALETVCLDDGSFNETNAVMDCPKDDAPYCVQCGIGRALCLDTNVTPPECIDDGEDDEGSHNETAAGDNATSLVSEASGDDETSNNTSSDVSGDDDRSDNSASGVSSGASAISGRHADVLPSIFVGAAMMVLLSSTHLLS